MKNTVSILLFFVLLLVVVWFFQNQNNVLQPIHPKSSITSVTPSIGQRTKDNNCVVHGALQDKECTPGAVFSGVTVQDICVRGYSKGVRNVLVKLKHEVYREYGITHHEKGEYEVDHLVSLELGGSNDIANLWPEAADPRPGFHEKDKVENYLHQQICSGQMSLIQAQALIANDWMDVFRLIQGVKNIEDGNDDEGTER